MLCDLRCCGMISWSLALIFFIAVTTNIICPWCAFQTFGFYSQLLRLNVQLCQNEKLIAISCVFYSLYRIYVEKTHDRVLSYLSALLLLYISMLYMYMQVCVCIYIHIQIYVYVKHVLCIILNHMSQIYGMDIKQVKITWKEEHVRDRLQCLGIEFCFCFKSRRIGLYR